MFRRSLLNCRVKTRVTILGLSVIFICSLLMYRALNSHTTVSHPGHSHEPNFEHNSQRLHSEHKQPNLPFLNNFEEKFHEHFQENQKAVKDPLNEGFIEKKFEEFKYRDLLNADNTEALIKFLKKLYPTNWAEASETDEVALDLKYLLLDYGLNSNMSCKQIDGMRLGGPVSHSGSQLIDYVYDGADDSGASNILGYGHNYGGKANERTSYVVKSSSSDQETKIACMKQVYDADRCAAMGNYRLLREVLLLTALRHPNIVAMKGYCLRGNRVATKLQEKGVIVLTEVGTPLTLSVISGTTWFQKLSMAQDISKLIQYLDKSPLGSLRFKKLSLKDFVLVQGIIIKLSDLDDLELGNKACTEDSHCEIKSGTKGVFCKNGYCEGLNHIISFNIAAKEVLQYILQNPPGNDEQSLLTSLRKLEISSVQFVKELQILLNKSKQEDLWPDEDRKPAIIAGNKRESKGSLIDNKHNNEDSHAKDISQDSLDEVLTNFVRYNQKNFAGIYDYQCTGSRVSWGCVHTVTSLLEGATACLKDRSCQCFITFSTQPESDNLMTVVFKNGTDPNPHKSSGTTLFIRRPPLDTQEADINRDDRSAKHKEKREAPVTKPSSQVHNCLDHILETQETARYTREKRLMAHLGLKGTREQAWRRAALKLNMEGQSQLVKVQGGGGRFVANLTNRDEGDEATKAKKVEFISEDGPHVYHLAYAVVYHLDRLLGLYQTPPCIGKQLPAEAVDQYLRKKEWDEIFRPLIESDGTLSGLMVAPMPHIMKNTKLTLSPLEAMTTEIAPFSRSEKFQLEYILLWWLGKIDYSSSDHQGYKEHFIHFYADKAFANIDLDLSGYLNHCQFPNVIYKSLACFWCDSKQDALDTPSDNVCSLGEEAIKRTRAMFAKDAEFFIHNMREEELIGTINSAASSILRNINVCIKTFGREDVLY